MFQSIITWNKELIRGGASTRRKKPRLFDIKENLYAIIISTWRSNTLTFIGLQPNAEKRNYDGSGTHVPTVNWLQNKQLLVIVCIV